MLQIIKQFITLSNRRYSASSGQNNTVRLGYILYEAEGGVSSKESPIIILHGLLGSKENWSSIGKSLAKTTKRAILTLDARNHGASTHTSEFSYKLMMEDLVLFLREQNLDEASFIGHSMGGRTAMMLALHKPEKVRDLVVVDISPLGGHRPAGDSVPLILEVLRTLKLDPSSSRTEARKQAQEQLSKQLPDKFLVSWLLTNLAPGVGGNQDWHWKINIDAIVKNHESILYEFSLGGLPYEKPTLFVGGELSPYLKPEMIPEIKKSFFPNATFSFVEGANHWVHADKPRAFLDLVSKFYGLH